MPRPALPPAIRIRIQALRADARRIASEIRALQSPPEVRPTWTCGLCGHMWVGARGKHSEKTPPRVCTKCKSTRWNRPPPSSLCTPAPQEVEEWPASPGVPPVLSVHEQLDALAASVGLSAPPRASRDLVRDILASARPAPAPPPAPARDPLTEPSERNLDDYYALTRPAEVP